jgi:NADPH:quinone reductase-like Zn-dependent oxidoreductase
MRALTISQHGGLEQLQLRDDLPTPELVDSTSVRVRIRAAALNHLDLWTIGGLPGITIRPPWVLGADGAGVVDAIGNDVTRVRPGDIVFINPGISCRRCEYCLDGEHSLCVRFGILGEHHPGTLAEYIVLPEPNVRRIDPSTSVTSAAAYPLVTLTAWRMAITRASVNEGDEVLIWGIGGGVALAALEICKQRGARVWVTSSSDAKLERARALGADETLNHRTQDVAREIRSRTAKRGVDVVLDNIGRDTWTASLGALGKRGRLVTVGGTSGPLVETDVRRLFWNQWTIMGSTMGNDREFDAITDEFTAARLHPIVDSTFPLDRSNEAFERLRAGEQFGKIVVEI